MCVLIARFKQSEPRYRLSEDEKFYLLSCSDLLNVIPAVIEGVPALHDFFWGKIPERTYTRQVHTSSAAARRARQDANELKAPERFRAMHEHLTQGLRYFDESYAAALAYPADPQRTHIAKAIELALLGGAELREAKAAWVQIEQSTRGE
ncbi:MAG: hypothetical protein ACP5E9_01250 [Candidatus Methanospirareceae archaeon]